MKWPLMCHSVERTRFSSVVFQDFLGLFTLQTLVDVGRNKARGKRAARTERGEESEEFLRAGSAWRPDGILMTSSSLDDLRLVVSCFIKYS